jgi:hypothetical protein
MNDRFSISPSPQATSPQLETKPSLVGSDPEAFWDAFVAAQERSKRTLVLADGIAAGKAYAAFLMAYTRPATKGAA